jgi:hypothetical protein
VLHYSQPLENANSPLYLAERLTADGNPLPAFWVAAGTNDKADYKPASMFVAAVDRIEQVPFVNFNAGDTANAWSTALPVALSWLWQQLAPSDLRVLFPARGPAGNLTTLSVPPVKRGAPRLPAKATELAAGLAFEGAGGVADHRNWLR